VQVDCDNGFPKFANMNLNLIGKNALVCGASQGIGAAAAIELSQMGANVTLMARDAERLTQQ
jgi:3-oxoacyl-[acyl-carrier protein] reductase